MAKKKNISASNIISFYMDYVLEHNKQPKTVYAFAKENNFESISLTVRKENVHAWKIYEVLGYHKIILKSLNFTSTLVTLKL